jgi:hypothetical protein
MKFLVGAVVTMMFLGWLSVANATEILTHKRTVEYKVVEPCGIVVAEGEAILEWADCKGDYELVTIDYEDYDHPLTLLFSAGDPDFDAAADDHIWPLLCHKAMKCAPDVYCAGCNLCEWYYYRTAACWAGDEVMAHAYLPNCMALEIIDVY